MAEAAASLRELNRSEQLFRNIRMSASDVAQKAGEVAAGLKQGSQADLDRLTAAAKQLAAAAIAADVLRESFADLAGRFEESFEGEQPLSELHANHLQRRKAHAPKPDADPIMRTFKESMQRELSEEEEDDADGDTDLVVEKQALNTVCPITRKEMKDPVRLKTCKHTFERTAIEQVIRVARGTAKCPQAGCANKKATMADLEPDKAVLRELKRKKAMAAAGVSQAVSQVPDSEVIMDF
eukprot:TRINITY_DN8813_c0_g1_i1.p1 TRINITY_DN8813_c0_g1~~TRINITY_DN8813_c0_g1_i1.p1  ORF type:complete len:239 (-),score=52.06 TRINITY_DN8813_c0_g1_i1:68-784(-)